MNKTSLAVAVALATGSSTSWADDGAAKAFEREFVDVQMEVHGQNSVDMADHPDAPSKGTGLMIGGLVVGGVGAVSLAMGGLFYQSADTYTEPNNTPSNVMFGIGAVALTGGSIMLIVSLVQRSHYNDWLEEAKGEQGLLEDLVVQPLPGGGALGWQGTF